MVTKGFSDLPPPGEPPVPVHDEGYVPRQRSPLKNINEKSVQPGVGHLKLSQYLSELRLRFLF